MKITIDIPDAKHRQLKKRAAAEGATMKSLVLRGIEAVLAKPEPHRKKLRLPLIHSREPGTLNIDNERIYDLIFP